MFAIARPEARGLLLMGGRGSQMLLMIWNLALKGEAVQMAGFYVTNITVMCVWSDYLW